MYACITINTFRLKYIEQSSAALNAPNVKPRFDYGEATTQEQGGSWRMSWASNDTERSLPPGTQIILCTLNWNTCHGSICSLFIREISSLKKKKKKLQAKENGKKTFCMYKVLHPVLYVTHYRYLKLKYNTKMQYNMLLWLENVVYIFLNLQLSLTT